MSLKGVGSTETTTVVLAEEDVESLLVWACFWRGLEDSELRVQCGGSKPFLWTCIVPSHSISCS